MPIQPWFPDAKLGIFVHWGIYAVDGVTESWSFYNGEVTYEQYMAQLGGFIAEKYDPGAWADLFVRAGAGYAELTARHHDGVSLWDTAYGDLSMVGPSPAARDLVAGYVDAVRDRGLKVGLYYSHSDWSHCDYPTIRAPEHTRSEYANHPYSEPAEGEPEDPGAWRRYLAYRDGQITELVTRFRPDLLWFDGDWERTEEQWRIRELSELILTHVPEVVLNARLPGYGDYATPSRSADAGA